MTIVRIVLIPWQYPTMQVIDLMNAVNAWEETLSDKGNTS